MTGARDVVRDAARTAHPSDPNARRGRPPPQGAVKASGAAVLVVTHLTVVEYVARKILRRCPPQIELNDLVSAGYLGLIDAARRFEPARGFAFRTFADPRIRGAILDFLRSEDVLSRTDRRKRGPADDARPIVNQLDDTALAAIDPRPGPEETCVANDTARRVRVAITTLPRRDARMVRARYLDDRTCLDIGREFGIGQPRVSQVLKRAKARLRVRLAA